MRDLYRYDEIDAKTEIFGVVADPVAHSHSPLIHNRAFKAAGLNARYFPFLVNKSDLPNFIEHCGEFGIQGIKRNDSTQGGRTGILYPSGIKREGNRRGQHAGF